VYVLEGFLADEVFPSPKDHDHDVGDSVDWSVNATVRGTIPESGVPMNLTMGGVEGVTVKALGRVPDSPSELVTTTSHTPSAAPVRPKEQVICVEETTVTPVAGMSEEPALRNTTAAPL
jgi:hypothetical protein